MVWQQLDINIVMLVFCRKWLDCYILLSFLKFQSNYKFIYIYLLDCDHCPGSHNTEPTSIQSLFALFTIIRKKNIIIFENAKKI